MKDSSEVMLIIKTNIKTDKKNEFVKWQEKLNKVVEKFTGFLSQTIAPPNLPTQPNWIIIQNFDSIQTAKAWLKSNERQELLNEVLPLIVGIDKVYLVEEKKQDQNAVTATISTTVAPEFEQKFLQWQTQIASVQSKFPGFLGYKIEKPEPGKNKWITIVAFNSDKNLDKWLQSNERQEMLNELNKISIESHTQKIYSGFDFWFERKDAKRSPWKESMLVLLTLYPVVFLLSFVQNPVIRRGVPFWLALFFGNALSTVILGYITTPWLMKFFSWWLNPKTEFDKKYNYLGTLIVILLYGLCLVVGYLLSRYL